MSELEIIIAKRGVSMSGVGTAKAKNYFKKVGEVGVWSACCSGERSLKRLHWILGPGHCWV